MTNNSCSLTKSLSPVSNFENSHCSRYSFDPSIVSGLPSKIGGNLWCKMHKQAANLTTAEEENKLICFIYFVCSHFSCSICRGHCQEYIHKYPPENYRGSYYRGYYIGLFIYLWRFHNNVNIRLAKPVLPFLPIFQQYFNH